MTKKCKNCGHSHIAETGGKDGYTITRERLPDCTKCDCGAFVEEK